MQDANSKPAAADATPLPSDLGACHTLILEQAQALVGAEASQKALRREVDELKVYVQRLLHQLYGRRSERATFDPRQQVLDFGDDPAAQDALAEAAAEAEKILEEEVTVRRKVCKKPKEPRQEKFPEHFPRVEKVVEPPAAERECPEHGPKQLIGYDVVESLMYERPKLWVLVSKYAKYACVSQPDCGVTQAARPTGLVEGCRYDTSVAVEVIANKYAYHLPLYREQDLFARSGWTPSRSTLLNLLCASAFVLEPLAACMRAPAFGQRRAGLRRDAVDADRAAGPPGARSGQPASTARLRGLEEGDRRREVRVSTRGCGATARSTCRSTSSTSR